MKPTMRFHKFVSALERTGQVFPKKVKSRFKQTGFGARHFWN